MRCSSEPCRSFLGRARGAICIRCNTLAMRACRHLIMCTGTVVGCAVVKNQRQERKGLMPALHTFPSNTLEQRGHNLARCWVPEGETEGWHPCLATCIAVQAHVGNGRSHEGCEVCNGSHNTVQCPLGLMGCHEVCSHHRRFRFATTDAAAKKADFA